MIDIYIIKNNKEKYFASLNEEDYIYLRDFFDDFFKKTGYRIDEYGDVVLDTSQLEILVDLLKNKNKNKNLDKYIHFFSSLLNKGEKVGFFGD